MTALRFTLHSEGSSDRTLIPILLWTLRQHSRRNFQRQKIHRLAELIGDFSPLRQLPAFDAFEKDVCRLLAARGW